MLGLGMLLAGLPIFAWHNQARAERALEARRAERETAESNPMGDPPVAPPDDNRHDDPAV
ncbi:MAG TPA: hypothetical protein PLJ12_04625 [Planctomycetota bacterium]|nr:hypothetical protein [Planctomycetota bacterium]